ncbi:bifunctional adenosylcobinamide kinase/adenosylcobinamide-phosphate guanylyltransferase [Psychrobacillus psychrodurans]|uniref:Bifunctional adenosylcobinamide kinase/adenosylcobinamide-phosphate guanylyltransferase n=1 Tax=Psychrobacillus psychrodurans TaxID=126157 RepID=A0A9X3L6Q5_9BACI|nr:bifunctional adenosylcobinamide kinase/adenosylcobinamide-phosphate guanylyltransferase [Psychrobacillus psychrodurans]MCZ8532120.1 bifunctional adenosylcobinamide kinase/adenosylcobinamide-phosphate guanylyltransferase [Psychrobacillus psychrodurans]
MHVIFGGAFNGKRAYVENMIQGRKAQWIDAELDVLVLLPDVEVVVILGVENLLESKGKKLIGTLEIWDKQAEVIVIATEIGRGIVPMDASMRKLRDDVGRFYQQLFTNASRVTRIWYGISQTLKGDEQIENLH